MKEIQLTQGKIALVDDEDFEYLNQWKWCAWKGHKTYYAARAKKIDGKQKIFFMHQFILGESPLHKMPDHIDGNGLNNQQHNLRFVTKRQNGQNRHQIKTSKYPGVSYYKREKRWFAEIQINGVKHQLGRYPTETEAFNAYRGAVENIGETVVDHGR